MSGFRTNATSSTNAAAAAQRAEKQRNEADLKEFKDLGTQLEADATTILTGNPHKGGHSKRNADNRIRQATERLAENRERHAELGLDLEKRGVLAEGDTTREINSIIDGAERQAFINQNPDREIHLDRVNGDEGAKAFLEGQAGLTTDDLKAGDRDFDGILSAGEAFDLSREKDSFEGANISSQQAMSALLGYDNVQAPGFVARVGRGLADGMSDVQKGVEGYTAAAQDAVGHNVVTDALAGTVDGVSSGVTGLVGLAGNAATLVDDPKSQAMAKEVMENPGHYAGAVVDAAKEGIDKLMEEGATVKGTAKFIGGFVGFGIASKGVRKGAAIVREAGPLKAGAAAAVGTAGLKAAMDGADAKAADQRRAEAEAQTEEQAVFKPWELAGLGGPQGK